MAAAAVLEAVQAAAWLSDDTFSSLLSPDMSTLLACCSSSLSTDASSALSLLQQPAVKDASAPPVTRPATYYRVAPRTVPLKHTRRRRKVGGGGGGGGEEGGDEEGGGWDGGFYGGGGFGGGDGKRWWDRWGDRWGDDSWRRGRGGEDDAVALIYQLACWLSFAGCVHHVMQKGVIEGTRAEERREGGVGGLGKCGGGLGRGMLVASGGARKEVLSC